MGISGNKSAMVQQSAGIPMESLPALLELLDARSLANLRRAFRMPGLSREAHLAELRAAVLEQLLSTKFPFTHAAYVLGLNGPYYSLDTIAERHYGIPKALPSLVCKLFRLAVPDVAFTTLRVQKFAAAANFGGQHRTLAFNLSSEALEQAEGVDVPEAEAAGDAVSVDTELKETTPLLVSPRLGLPGYVLCLTEGCWGGYGEVCEDLSSGSWRWLAGPEARARWVQFPADAWLRWHWPRQGDLYAITVTCEAPENCIKIRQRERWQMVRIGFLLPSDALPTDEEDAASDAGKDCDAAQTLEAPAAPPSSRPSSARVRAARRLLGLADEAPVTQPVVEDCFRRAARQVHPDRAAADSPIPASWLMSQLIWARRILHQEATTASLEGEAEQEEAAEILMLAAPHPE